MTEHNNKNNKTKAPDLVDFTVNGMTMSTSLTKKYKNRRLWTRPDEKKVISFIPGTVREVFIQAGDHVDENDRLLILEAMKMMNVITSPMTGKISKIHINSGDKVAKGEVMIEFE